MEFGFSGIDYMTDLVPWIAGVTVVFIIFMIVVKVFGKRWRPGGGLESGMRFQDLDTMRKKGLISEEEYKTVRATLAKREAERLRERGEVDRDRQILAEVALNPDAARKLLPADAVDAREERERPQAQPSDVQQGGQHAAPPPSMNNPRVVAARNEARSGPRPANGATTGKPRDIDVLFEKGAISKEEYERLKKFFE